MTTIFPQVCSPVSVINFFNREIHIKRDDLLQPTEFSGNKARKFRYFLDHDLQGINKLIGYGSPQANSLYSLSALAKLKNLPLDFYVDHIASQILQNPQGNYAAALENGANIIDLSQASDRENLSCFDYITQKACKRNPQAFFIPEGGRFEYAQYGVNQLAQEIADWVQQENYDQILVCLPSGTGTTALFLNQYFLEHNLSIKVITVACVGGSEYLQMQFSELYSNKNYHPQIIELNKKYHFGKLYPECYEIWQQLCEAGISFDLLYDPIAWLALQKYLAENTVEMPILYIHQGGLLGNATMLPRYRRKY